MSDASDNSTTVNKYLVPVTTDNIVLKWDGNTASLAGILYETFQFWEREGLFQEFLLTNAVPIKGGKLAVDSDLAIQFMDGTINDSAFRLTHKPPYTSDTWAGAAEASRKLERSTPRPVTRAWYLVTAQAAITL